MDLVKPLQAYITSHYTDAEAKVVSESHQQQRQSNTYTTACWRLEIVNCACVRDVVCFGCCCWCVDDRVVVCYV